MASTRQFLSRLFTLVPGRDGQSRFLQTAALEPPGETVSLAVLPTPPAQRRRRGPEPQRILMEALAVKVLHAWLQNRHQTLFPLTLSFRSLDASGRELLVHMMATAAQADGETDPEEQERIEKALEATGAGEAERHLLPEAMRQPRLLSHLLREAQETHLGAHAYAASLLALDQRSRVNQAWLDYLAARLGLPTEVTNSLNRRYRG